MTREIPLNHGYVALIDDDDFERISKKKWHVTKGRYTHYASCHHTYGIHEHMHRVIMNPPKDMYIDHIDGNGLNNQKSNLRIVTTRQNCQNRHPRKYKKVSKYPGVSFHTKTQTWYPRARIGPGGLKTKSHGYYHSEEEAYIEYLKLVNSEEKTCQKQL